MTRVGRWRGAGVLAGMLLLLAGACNRAPVTVRAERLAPLPRGEVRYIAVLPFETASGVGAEAFESGQETRGEAPATTVHRAVTEEMLTLPGWEVTDDLVVGEAVRKLYGTIRPVGPDEVAAVGRLLGVDAVVHGIVRGFEVRVGAEYAASRPALVDFAVTLALFPAGETVWRAEFVERQQPLSDDLWNLFGFVRARGRWLRAGELAIIGARQVTGQMHHVLYGGAATPVPKPEW